MDKHDLISRLKDLAIELGRTPLYREFKQRVVGAQHQTETRFGSYAVLLQAAGLEPTNRNRKVDNSIFQRDIDKHIEEQNVTGPAKVRLPYPSLAVISDIHWPWGNPEVGKRFYEYVGDEKPAVVAINGDAWDMYSHAKFPRSHNIFTPQEETRKAREMNENFWKEIKRIHPKARCVQMLGNHDLRPMKRILETYPEAEDWIKQKLVELFTYEGVETFFDAREELYLNENTILFHGYRTKLGDHRDFTLLNCINGHSHVGGVVFKKVRGETLFELNSGFAGNPEGKGLTYTPQKIVPWTPGFAAINKYGPQFIPV